MRHCLAVAGLVLSTIGALLLLWFPPVVKVFTPEGAEISGWYGKTTPGGRRRYVLHKWGFWIAILMIAGGFLLQLLDHLRS